MAKALTCLAYLAFLQFTWFLLFTSVLSSASYDLGRTFKYHYVTTVSFNEPDVVRGKNVTYQVVADVAVTTIWQKSDSENLLLLQIESPTLQVVPKGSPTGELSNHHSNLDYFKDGGNTVLHLRDGVIHSIYTDSSKGDFNALQAGIASLFQFQIKTKEHIEVDSSGRCTVVYKSSANYVQKYKKNCVEFVSSKPNKEHPNNVLGVTVTSKNEAWYKLNKQNIIESMVSDEIHQMTLNVYQKVGAHIQAKQSLILTGESDGSKLVSRSNTEQETLKYLSSVLGAKFIPATFNSSDEAVQPESCKDLPEYVRKKQSFLKTENLAKSTTSTTFLDLVQKFRACNKTVLTKIFKNSKNKHILPQLIDIACAAQTNEAFESVFGFVKFDGDSLDLPERYLYGLSTTPYPTEKIVLSLLNLVKRGIKNEKLFETVLLTLASVTKTYRSHYGNDEVVEQVTIVLLEKLRESEDDECKLRLLRAFRNAALPDAIPALVDQVQFGGKIASQAVQAIHAIGSTALTPEIKKLLLDVYYQVYKKQDSTARIIAAEILLDNFPSTELLDALLITPDNSSEVKTYVIAKIFHKAKSDIKFREMLIEMLRNQSFGNYDVLAQGGDSTFFSHLLAGDEKVNATYDLRLEIIPGGLLKRSNFDVAFNIGNDSLNAFTFGIFAAGLRSLAGGTPTEDDDDPNVDLTAGMAINILNVDLRPYMLFTGQGELMGHVWSGTGSETTPIFQGNFLLHDHQQAIYLQNGLVLQLSMLGALSFDMSGSVQTSLWSRTAHTVILARASVVVQSVARIDSYFIKSNVRVNAGGEAALEFTIDADFADTPKMCTQMSRPPFSIRSAISKVENIPGSKHKLRRTRKTLVSIPGKSFELNRKNTELCSLMSTE